MFVTLANFGSATATTVRATLSTTTPGVFIAQANGAYPDLPPGGSGVNVAPFQISTTPAFVCGTPVVCTLVAKCQQSATTNQFRLPSGSPGTPVRFDNSTPAAIPDLGETNSTVAVTNINTALSKVTVALYITHTYDSDLLIQLISPDGTTNTLSANNGANGQNYGAGCSPDSLRTIFDDASTNPIAVGSAPFVGTFQPQTPLSVFDGKAGTNVNGLWRLQIADQVALDVGTLQCWSLFLTPAACANGGGECPGADLALGMIAQPSPVILGQNLTYTISVTNNGPSSATSVFVIHQLPSSVLFRSASSSQGTCSQSGGIVSCNLGSLAPEGTATVTVVVSPGATGTISSTASVTAAQPDPNQSNNSATVLTQVDPASADLAVGLAAVPNPVVIGSTLTYTVSVVNNGPSDASGVTVTNALPAGVAVLSATVSQGSITPGGNSWTIGTLLNGAHATATITVIPTVIGSLIATSTVQGNQFDPVPANNTATIAITVGPAADLALGIADSRTRSCGEQCDLHDRRDQPGSQRRHGRHRQRLAPARCHRAFHQRHARSRFHLRQHPDLDSGHFGQRGQGHAHDCGRHHHQRHAHHHRHGRRRPTRSQPGQQQRDRDRGGGRAVCHHRRRRGHLDL